MSPAPNSQYFPSSLQSGGWADSAEQILETLACRQKVEASILTLKNRDQSHRRARNWALLAAGIAVPAALVFPGLATVAIMVGFAASAGGISLYRRSQNKKLATLQYWVKDLTTQLGQQKFLSKGHEATRANNRHNDGPWFLNPSRRPAAMDDHPNDSDRDQDGGSGVVAPNRPKGPKQPPLAARAVAMVLTR